MAITTYAELQTAVASWHHRSVAEIVDFITLAEKRINNSLMSRLGEAESTLTGTIGSRYIALPSGFIAPRGLWLTTYGNRIPVEFKSPEELPITTSGNGQPYYYTVDGSNVAFDYLLSQAFTYVLRYKKGYDIASTSTNHILSNYPACYLYGALREASLFSEDDTAANKYDSLFTQALEEAASAEFGNRTLAELTVDAPLAINRMQNIISGDL